LTIAVLIAAAIVILCLIGYQILQRRRVSALIDNISATSAAYQQEEEAAAPPAGSTERIERAVAGPHRILSTVRGSELIFLLVSPRAPQLHALRSRPIAEVWQAIAEGKIDTLLGRRLGADGRIGRVRDLSAMLPTLHRRAFRHFMFSCAVQEAKAEPEPPIDDYFGALNMVAETPDLIDFVYEGRTKTIGPTFARAPPFDTAASMPAYRPPAPNRRSVLFLGQNYYQFHQLAVGLQARGWDAVSVSLYDPEGPSAQFSHGGDVNLFDHDPVERMQKARAFFQDAADRFGVIHMYGMGAPGLFPENWEYTDKPRAIPWDLIEWRRRGAIIGYTPTGCNDGARQSSIKAISGVCARCTWELRPDVCRDDANAVWGRKLEAFCTWISGETDFAVDGRVGGRYTRYPVTGVMDPGVWRPDIEPPEDMRIERRPGEILIYHAVGNYETRRVDDRDVKGTGAVMAAIGRLQAEGAPVRLIFATDIPSSRVRFLQVQADIVVDQLNYGRIGANARECMMLGKPVISRQVADQGAPLGPLKYVLDSPVIHADEDTIYAVLKDLIAKPETWGPIGRASRDFAVKWHSAAGSAERFETIIDRIAAGLPPADPAIGYE
jgi:hypothetical protein